MKPQKQNGKIIVVAILLLLFALSRCAADSIRGDSQIGLVLSGGGAKGAYEIGVWQALVESDLANDVSSISGTSVGAINAALFASVKDTNKCIRLWEEEIGGIFQFNTNLVVNVLGADGRAKVERAYSRMHRNIAEDMAYEASKRGCSVSELPQAVKNEIEERCESVARKRLFLQLPKLKTFADMLTGYDGSLPQEGFLSSSKLHASIMRALPEKWPTTAPAVYATALRKGKEKFSIERFSLKTARPEQRASMICASACIPIIFGVYEFDGETYIDGFYESKGGDNVPLEPILNNHLDIKTVIVVYLKDEEHLDVNRRTKNRKAADAVGVRLVEIIPSEDIGGAFGLGGVFDTSPETARRLIELGRKDAREALVKAKLISSGNGDG